MITREAAGALSSNTRQYYDNVLKWKTRRGCIGDGHLEVVLPNYNNGEILHKVLDSILSQEGWQPRIRIIDNCSTDRSWDCIEQYTREHAGITAERMELNTGPHHTANILLRSSSAKYVLFASGNDIFVDKYAFLDMYTVLEEEEDIILVYGRNCRNGIYSEPDEYSFSIPGNKLRKELEIGDMDCMNTATWLYTSSEPLWGMYRANVPRMIPTQQSYGADHAFVGLCAFGGGIYAINRMFRSVEGERRDLTSLRRLQSQKSYGEEGSYDELPMETANMIALCYTYMLSIRNSFLSAERKEALYHDTLCILHYRFYSQILQEYHNISKACRTGKYSEVKGLSRLEADEQLKYIEQFIRPFLVLFTRQFLSKSLR